MARLSLILLTGIRMVLAQRLPSAESPDQTRPPYEGVVAVHTLIE
ncbi:hypothetical protein CTAM01_17224 [Colletotrichum tamarilloi]|uniref:Uncharacterized protein n=1 Tax=Colletotrichum tamarilloi TaxID=1209934 RepID=A0ABQ9QG85_9PEZI|nr:uncharacterized protein CTAM01_17224 [Colletotrichum tamarilloi]KAK1456022.1 hypothetical protein CTAM01_17224 [Colletotrichum tamarilloi]